ncbi:MAG: LuxR family transcriptional regulator, partial [Actinomycetota bacterium]|nr:LuxR family transcriptional regulator [Actinomycetota bacterium]
MGAYARERAVDHIASLAGRGLDLRAFWDAAAEAVSSAVAHYMAPCWFTLDPASLLVTSHYDHGQIPELPPEWLAQEYYADDFHDMAGVARSERGVSTLHEASGGDPSTSPRWQANIQYGGDQELLLALRTPAREAWGVLGLYREPEQPKFDADELAFLQTVSAPFAEGARRGLLIGEASDPEAPEAPGLVVLNEDWDVESLTPGAEDWLAELPDGDWRGQRKLPPSVLAVAGRAVGTADGESAPGEVAFARVLST